jgi:1,2-diacylglycerol 3-alpha-glucosyltransferase
MSRILVLSFTFPPNADGVSISAYRLAMGLAQRSYTVAVATEFHPDRNLDAYQPLLVKHFQISGTTSWRDPVRGQIDECVAFMRDFDPDVVFCECWELWTMILAIREFQGGKVKLVLVSHGYSFHLIEWHRRFPFGLGQWLARIPAVVALPFKMRRFHTLVINSHRRNLGRFFDGLVASLIHHPGICVLPNPIDMSEFTADAPDFRKDYRIESGPMYFCVANYSKRKNQMLALRAFREIALEKSTLVFIGSEFNDYSTRLFQLDQELKEAGFSKGRVLILEKIERPVVIAALKACDVVVLSALAETMPVAILEAMAASKPFISTDTGCVRELPGGIVVRNLEDFRNAMLLLAGDPRRRQELGNLGRVACENSCSMQKVLNEFQQICEEKI